MDWKKRAQRRAQLETPQRALVMELVEGPTRAPGHQWRFHFPGLLGNSIDPSPDGKRLAVLKPPEMEAAGDHVTFFFNFTDELRRIAPAAKK